jgi:hypothetical protein
VQTDFGSLDRTPTTNDKAKRNTAPRGVDADEGSNENWDILKTSSPMKLAAKTNSSFSSVPSRPQPADPRKSRRDLYRKPADNDNLHQPRHRVHFSSPSESGLGTENRYDGMRGGASDNKSGQDQGQDHDFSNVEQQFYIIPTGSQQRENGTSSDTGSVQSAPAGQATFNMSCSNASYRSSYSSSSSSSSIQFSGRQVTTTTQQKGPNRRGSARSADNATFTSFMYRQRNDFNDRRSTGTIELYLPSKDAPTKNSSRQTNHTTNSIGNNGQVGGSSKEAASAAATTTTTMTQHPTKQQLKLTRKIIDGA